MFQSFNCQNCGLSIQAKDHKRHEITGDVYYECPSCKTKNKMTQIPTEEGSPIKFIPNGILK
jgi:hypothetical protein